MGVLWFIAVGIGILSYQIVPKDYVDNDGMKLIPYIYTYINIDQKIENIQKPRWTCDGLLFWDYDNENNVFKSSDYDGL